MTIPRLYVTMSTCRDGDTVTTAASGVGVIPIQSECAGNVGRASCLVHLITSVRDACGDLGVHSERVGERVRW